MYIAACKQTHVCNIYTLCILQCVTAVTAENILVATGENLKQRLLKDTLAQIDRDL